MVGCTGNFPIVGRRCRIAKHVCAVLLRCVVPIRGRARFRCLELPRVGDSVEETLFQLSGLFSSPWHQLRKSDRRLLGGNLFLWFSSKYPVVLAVVVVGCMQAVCSNSHVGSRRGYI